MAVLNHRSSRVADGGEQDRPSPQQLAGAPRDIDADEREHAHETDQQPDQASSIDPLTRLEPQRQQRDDQRHRSDDDRRERRRDVALTGGDQRERHGDLEHRVGQQPAQPAAQAGQHARAPGHRTDDDRGRRDARPGQEDRRHAAVDRNANEQIGDAPEDRNRREGEPGASTHRANMSGRATRASARPAAGRRPRAALHYATCWGQRSRSEAH